MDDSGEVTRIVRIVFVVELHLSANPLKQCQKSETIMAAAAHAQEKPKQSREELRRKNFKRVCEELNKVGELFREVLNIRSSAKLDMLCPANTSCRNPGPVIL